MNAVECNDIASVTETKAVSTIQLYIGLRWVIKVECAQSRTRVWHASMRMWGHNDGMTIKRITNGLACRIVALNSLTCLLRAS